VSGVVSAGKCPFCSRLNRSYQVRQYGGAVDPAYWWMFGYPSWVGTLCSEAQPYPVCGDCGREFGSYLLACLSSAVVRLLKPGFLGTPPANYELSAVLTGGEGVNSIYFVKDLGPDVPDCRTWNALVLPYDHFDDQWGNDACKDGQVAVTPVADSACDNGIRCNWDNMSQEPGICYEFPSGFGPETILTLNGLPNNWLCTCSRLNRSYTIGRLRCAAVVIVDRGTFGGCGASIQAPTGLMSPPCQQDYAIKAALAADPGGGYWVQGEVFFQAGYSWQYQDCYVSLVYQTHIDALASLNGLILPFYGERLWNGCGGNNCPDDAGNSWMQVWLP
jgi:hypothetical protein